MFRNPTAKAKDKSAIAKKIKAVTKALEEYRWNVQDPGRAADLTNIISNLRTIEHMNITFLAGVLKWYFTENVLEFNYDAHSKYLDEIYVLTKDRTEPPDSGFLVAMSADFIRYATAVADAVANADT